MNTKKHQDYIYEQENYYDNPKETFMFLKNLITDSFDTAGVLDIGCAKGEFLYYLKKTYNYTKLAGIDYSENLIAQAKAFKKLSDGVRLEVLSAEDFELHELFEVITISGVLSYFDNPFSCLEMIEKHLKENGRAYILGGFNDDDVDVLIRYKNNKYFSDFESGWNYHSISTIKKCLEKLNMKLINIHKFDFSFELSKNEDPARSWHINTNIGRKLTNGLGMIYDIRVIEIIKSV